MIDLFTDRWIIYLFMYLFTYYVFQLELPLYETAMQKMRSLARAVLQSDDQVEEQIKFIQQSVTQLLKARHVLKCSYVYGYYLEQTGYKKPIFECMQVTTGFPRRF